MIPAGLSREGTLLVRLLDGRVALVTGAAGGIGRAICHELSRQGAAVLCADILADKAQEVASEIRAEGDKAAATYVDQAQYASASAMVEAAVVEFGKLDILINNAALFSGLTRRAALEIEPDEWMKVVQVNLTGLFFCCKAALPVMIEGGYGKVVNVSSSSVFRAENRLAHYVAAKTGIIGLTRALAREYSDKGLTINTISPGATASGSSISTREYLEGLLPDRSIRRIQEPKDLVGSIIFLVSPLSDFMTGQHIVVDGGTEFN